MTPDVASESTGLLTELKALPLNHPKAKAVSTAFGLGPFRKIDHKPIGPLGNCYWNTDDHLNRAGGEAVYGWQILYWPRLYAMALHHAVWRDPETGKLVDLTANLQNETGGKTTFVADDSVTIDLSVPQCVPNKYYPLTDNPAVTRLIDAEIAQLNHTRRLTHKLRDAGVPWVPAGGYSLPDELVPQFQSELNEQHWHKLQVGSAMDACRNI